MILWLLACTQPEPPLKRSLDLYSQGLVKLEAGQFAQAAGDFEQAHLLAPGNGELLIWQAKALADSGDLSGAIALLDQAVLFGGVELGLRALGEPVLLEVLRSPELSAWDQDPRFADIRVQAQKMPTR